VSSKSSFWILKSFDSCITFALKVSLCSSFMSTTIYEALKLIKALGLNYDF